MSLVRFRARNHPQQVTDDSINDRRTPDSLFSQLHTDHRFTVDVAASAINAKLPRYFTKADSGLVQSWTAERVWCNPPYSELTPWVCKAWDAMTQEGCELVVMLLPANRTEQRFWSRLIEPFRDGKAAFCNVTLTTRFLAGRPRFGMAEGMPVPRGGWRPPFGCVLVTWDRAT